MVLPAYLVSGSGCRAATTLPRAAAERLARTPPFAGSLCGAARGATRRSPSSVAARATPAADALQLRRVDATRSTTLNRYPTRRRQHLGGPIPLVRGSGSQSTFESDFEQARTLNFEH